MVRTILALLFGAAAFAQQLYVIPDEVQTRWASPENWTGEKGKAATANAGRKGSPSFPLKAGEQRTLAEVRGESGTVRRIWATISDRSPRMLRGLRLDFYWDGAKTPAASAPFGDFFGTGIGRTTAFESALFVNAEGRSFVCYVPMPFRTGMRIVVSNESGVDLGSMFYDVDYTVGDRHGPDALYFHAHWRRENPTTLQKDYELLPKVSGKGRFLGVNVGVIADRKSYFKTWWGEGEVKMFVDGDTENPTLSGTGTEDYIGTGWGQGRYANMYQGCHIADHDAMRYCFYRYHIPDPVWFRKDLRVTIQQIGWYDQQSMGPMYKSGKPLYTAGKGLVEKDKFTEGLFERQDDWSSTAYFYLDKPENGLPPLAPVGKRTEGL